MNSRKLTVLPQGRVARATIPRTHQTGFSIIELMMSVVLLAIAMALAVPSYREMVEKRQLTYGAEQLMSFVNSAQSESIKKNRVLTVSYERTDDDDWCAGAVLGTTACDCGQTNTASADYCAIDSVPWIINNTHAGNHDLVQSMSGDGAYSFDPVRGLMTDLDDSLVIEMRSDDESYRLQLRVSNTGQVVLCSKDNGHDVPGYPVCPVQEITEETS
ncbi:GspH/FimT family pseudopilin [Elongatibacter sediminis]|uniref:Type II secretion system protein H n=1 Tax=Elongatibacter sediminis TaxID=3119006 RepID=A0AAW9RD32_9GAMM